MHLRDRVANLALLACATGVWGAVALHALTRSPRRDSDALLIGALLLGAAVALTLAPLAWLAAFARKRHIAYRGDWWVAGRRGALAGLAVALLVLLRGQGPFNVPIALFVVVMTIFVELALSLRR
jgi:hypothetical protein